MVILRWAVLVVSVVGLLSEALGVLRRPDPVGLLNLLAEKVRKDAVSRARAMCEAWAGVDVSKRAAVLLDAADDAVALERSWDRVSWRTRAEHDPSAERLAHGLHVLCVATLLAALWTSGSGVGPLRWAVGVWALSLVVAVLRRVRDARVEQEGLDALPGLLAALRARLASRERP